MIDAAQLIRLAMAASVLLLVTGLGMRATFADATSVLRHLFKAPYSLLRAIAAMNLVVPAAAVSIAAAFSLPFPVEVAMVAFSVSPVPPILPSKQMKFGGRARFVYGLLVAVSLLAIVVVPASVELVARVLGRHDHLSPATVAVLMGRTVLAPLALGIAIRSFAPGFAERWSGRVSGLGTILLVTASIPVLVVSWNGMVSLFHDGGVTGIVALAAISIGAGHVIGGPNEHDRTALGIVCAMRHPGVALAIATEASPDDKSMAAAILLCILIALVMTTVYGKLRVRGLPRGAAQAA